MSNEVVMVLGPPASGKSSYTKGLVEKNYWCLNRDSEGGKIVGLLPKLEALLQEQKNVVLDNLFPTMEVRRPFLELCKKYNVPCRCIIIDTPIEQCQINALHRMWDRYKKIFFNADDLKGIKDPNMFPPVVLFKYRKEYQKPNIAEGFKSIETVKFQRRPSAYTNGALILDYDGNVRDSLGPQDYPIQPKEVKILPGRADRIKKYKADHPDHLLLGVSNQSGVHKGILTHQMAVDCFDHTNKLLGHDIEYYFCPHQSNPPACYCRKPQSGNGVLLIEKYKLDPAKCLFVGDQTTDKSFAERVGFNFQFTHEFFE